MSAPRLSITIDDSQFVRLCRKYPVEIDNAFKRILSDGSIIVQKELTEQAPVGVTQMLAGRVQRTVTRAQARIKPLMAYAYWVENGRGAGKMPPWSGDAGKEFRQWVELRFGGSVPPFVVARAIGQKGTKPHPFVAPTHKITEPKVQRYAESEVTRIVRLLNKA